MKSNSNSISPEFWHNKRVLITGHTGFKGSWLSLWLLNLGANVYGISLEPTTEESIFKKGNLAKSMNSTIQNIRNYDLLYSTISKIKPDIIFHMAAQSLVRLSYESPIDTYATNIMGTINLLEVVRKLDATKLVINVTSDKCYENKEWYWGYREIEPMGGNDPYSSSKACSEIISAAYRASYFEKKGISLATVRAGNVIGGGDWAADRLIPDILKSIKNNTKLKIRNPNATRPWQHVLEPLSGYLMLAEKMWKLDDSIRYDEGWNFGPKYDDTKSVEWILSYLYDLYKIPPNWSLDESKNPKEAINLSLDSSKAFSLLGWKTQWNIETTLKKIVDWNSDFNEKIPVEKICLKQILQYNDEDY